MGYEIHVMVRWSGMGHEIPIMVGWVGYSEMGHGGVRWAMVV